jgi:hypothetical protein
MLNELGALLKYEFRYYSRILLPLYLTLILVALVARFHVNLKGLDDGAISLFILYYFIWIALFVAMTIITTVYIILRYVNNLMKDQGALMLTLPVSVWTLLSSKAIAAFCMVMLSTASVLISILFFAKEIGEWVSAYVAPQINFPVPNSGEIMIIIFIVCARTVQETCRIFLAITVSCLLPRFRFVVGCAVYLAIGFFVEQPVFEYASKNIDINYDFSLEYSFRFIFGNGFYLSLIPTGIAALAFTALYFWATGLLLKRAINLE